MGLYAPASTPRVTVDRVIRWIETGLAGPPGRLPLRPLLIRARSLERCFEILQATPIASLRAA